MIKQQILMPVDSCGHLQCHEGGIVREEASCDGMGIVLHHRS